MKILHFECHGGISGDMTLGALVDLGADPDELRGELGKLGREGWKLEFRREERNSIMGLHAEVDLGGSTDHHDDDGGPGHSHDGEHHHEHHTLGGHSHNSWREIRSLIEGSGIRAGAKRRALDIFTRIAEAEAHVHGVPAGEVTFHEVGALDSIIDIVGAAICLDMLRPDRITSTEIELGGGKVSCAHGILPVPAPATLLLVKGLPVKTGSFDKEMTTPTGAAILAASVDEFIPSWKPSGVFTELGTGYGIGARRLEHFNGLRVSWREQGEAGETPWESETLTLLEANIDDMTGEALGFLMERLFEAGALDVSYGPLTMKKSRPGTLVSVLGRAEQLRALRECLFRHSTTIGFRETGVNRLSLRRDEAPFRGPRGEVRGKRVYLGDKSRVKIEYEDRARLAREKNISLDEAGELLEGGPES